MMSAARTHQPSRIKRHAGGFTLVELLVALTLFALMSVLMFGGLRFGLRAWESGGERIDEAAQVEVVQSLLRRALSQARLPWEDQDRDILSVFSGTPDTVSFVAPLPSHSGSGGLAVFLLSEQRNSDGASLALAWRIFRPDDFDSAAFDEDRLLLENIGSIKFAYYGRVDASLPPNWLDRWDGLLGLPQLIRVRVSFPPGDRRRWPDLVVAPRLHEPYS
jgi:general secretion pathway protein J